jgi:osmotically-inducible protein OsmY
MINVLARDGIVELWGVVDNETEKKAVRVAAEETHGVKAVKDNLRIYRISSGF